MTRAGDWMQTATGRQFWPLDPRADEVYLDDIAHALSHQCRFAGHCREFYSVAQHSVLVAEWLIDHVPSDKQRYALYGLLHDAAEAYLVDLPRPVKRGMRAYRDAEVVVERAVFDRFGLAWPAPDIVQHADAVLLATEARDLMLPPPVPWMQMPPPWGNKIDPWIPSVARAAFMGMYYSLMAP